MVYSHSENKEIHIHYRISSIITLHYIAFYFQTRRSFDICAVAVTSYELDFVFYEFAYVLISLSSYERTLSHLRDCGVILNDNRHIRLEVIYHHIPYLLVNRK